MNDKTQGFVLQSIRYGDTSLIVKAFTLDNGLQTFMVKGVRGKSSKNRMAFFQPMTFLSFVQNCKPTKSGIGYIKDIELLYAYRSLASTMNKSAILIYLSDLLSHTLTQQERNEPLYRFVFNSVEWLDLVESGYANFPLYFTLELSRFLGFYPQSNYREHALFDMMEGQFVALQPPHAYILDEENSALLAQLLNLGVDELDKVPMTGLQRNALLDGVLTFMRLHAPMMKGLQSHEVLKEVLR
ncbi:MAG: DNA repair protein RecO [Bacteroidales bacterium]|nr:DNA repair protein RecO [Bacteroidales bacterium]